MGLDPGIRTGVKVAVVDATGKVLDTATIYPHEPRSDWDGSHRHPRPPGRQAQGRADRHRQRHRQPRDRQAGARRDEALPGSPAAPRSWSPKPAPRSIRPRNSPRGNSPTSTSRCAAPCRSPAACRTRWPNWSRSTRSRSASASTSTTSSRPSWRAALDAVVEDCVNAVGVDVNTASVPLLARVSGLNAGAGREHRQLPRRQRRLPHARGAEQGAAPRRQDLRAGRRLPAHRERRQPARRLVRAPGSLSGGREDHRRPQQADQGDPRRQPRPARRSNPAKFTDERFGLPTVQDILTELEKPGRDPRPEFKTATFEDGVEKIDRPAPGMMLEGVVTNVAAFGAFVDIGVHQDGLVHVSALSNRFVKDPHRWSRPANRQGEGAGSRSAAQAHRADHAHGRRAEPGQASRQRPDRTRQCPEPAGAAGSPGDSNAAVARPRPAMRWPPPSPN